MLAGLREQNRDLLGVISSDRFTTDQLRAGAWDGANIDVATVDWMYAFAGAFVQRNYRIDRITHTGEQWTAELGGLTTKLQAKSGRVVGRPCDADLFDDRCKLVTSSDARWEVNDVRVDPGSQDSTEPRRIFNAIIGDLPTTTNGYYKYGKLAWTTGANANIGVVSIVKGFTNAARLIELFEATPFDIEDNDEFTIFAGCDKLFDTCKTKFDPGATGEGNTLNYRGFHRMPGTDHVLRTPTNSN